MNSKVCEPPKGFAAKRCNIEKTIDEYSKNGKKKNGRDQLVVLGTLYSSIVFIILLYYYIINYNNLILLKCE